jgi:hypothetical protein
VNAALAAVLRPRDVFGPDVGAALFAANVDPAGAACQVGVAKALAVIARAEVGAFNACIRDRSKSGTLATATDVVGCRDAVEASTTSTSNASGASSRPSAPRRRLRRHSRDAAPARRRPRSRAVFPPMPGAACVSR